MLLFVLLWIYFPSRFQLVTVVDLSLQPKFQIASTSMYDRLGKYLQDCADDLDIENYFWNVFDELVHKRVQGGDKVSCKPTDG